MQWAKKQTGFTIVELLIVVVVIAILAAITIVAYNGITNRTKESSVMSSVSQALRKIETFKSASQTESYPTSAGEAGIANIDGVSYFPSTTQNSYCVQVKKDQITYSATNLKKTAIKAPCTENGLVGWWRLNGDGTDATSNGWNATITGLAAQGQNGQSGGAIDFDGTIPAGRLTGSEDILPVENTFSFWFNADTWNTGAATSFIAKRSGPTTGHFIMRLTSSNALSIDCGGSGNRWTTGNALALNQWMHVVVTCSPTTVAAYVNGALIGSANRTVGVLTNGTILQFGQDGSGYALDGRMDDIRLFDRALTAAEAQQLFTDGAQ